MLLWIVAALLIGLVAAFTARAKGRPFKPWLAYGTLLGVVALPHALLLREDDDGRNDARPGKAGGLFDFNPLAGRRADRFSDQDEPPGWNAGELPPEGFVMRASAPETDIAPVWSEDDFARIAGAGDGGNGRAHRARATGKARRESRDAAFGTREDVPSGPETGEATGESEAAKVFDESKIESLASRVEVPETTAPAAYESETASGEDQDATTMAPAGVEPAHDDDRSPERVATSYAEPEAAQAGQEPPSAEAEPGHGAEAWSDPEPPPPPPEAPDSSLDIPVPPPAFERSRQSRKAFSQPQRVLRSRRWDAGASVSEDYGREPRFNLGGGGTNDFDEREAVAMARRFAPHSADDARQSTYEERPRRGPGFRHVVAAACIALVTFLAWWQFGWLWAPSGSDATRSAATQEEPAGPTLENVSPVPIVPPESPGHDSRATASMGNDGEDASPDVALRSTNKRLPAPGEEVPLPPPMPEARARLGMTATSPPERAAEMEAVAAPPRKPVHPASSREQEPSSAAAGKGEISATGDLVARIQAELQKRGYDIDSADGRAGIKTRKAIVAFKRDQGMSVTPQVDDALIERLGIAGRRLYPFTPPNRRAAQ